MVRLVEFETKEMPFDVIDDVAIYMRNDPMIYRKSFFPAITKMQGLHKKGSTIDPDKCLGEVVDGAMESYCEKFNLGSPKNVFKKGDRESIINKLFAEEMTQIKNGEY